MQYIIIGICIDIFDHTVVPIDLLSWSFKLLRN